LRRRKPLDQLMSLLFLVRRTVFHQKESSENYRLALGIKGASASIPSAVLHAKSC